MRIKTVFFGSPQIAAQLLNYLILDQSIDIVLVITQPDKPVGKKLEITGTPVKYLANLNNIPTFNKNIKDKAILQELITLLKNLDLDLGILYAYGALIPEEIINIFPQGIWNVHPSLLPLYRGPSPTAYPLFLGDIKTGVTIMKLVKKLDAGPIISQKEITIPSNAQRDLLEKELTEIAYSILKDQWGKIEQKLVVETQTQDASKSTYTRLLKKEDGYISPTFIQDAINGSKISNEKLPIIMTDYMIKYDKIVQNTPAEILHNLFRAFYPWPGLWTLIETAQGKKRLKILEMIYIDGSVELTRVQLEGKDPVDFKTFNKAYNFLS